MSRDFQSIPVIDVGGLYSTDLADRLAVADKIRAASRDVGFFYVSGHGIGDQARDQLKAAAARFFDQPMAAKMQTYIGKSLNHSGYVPEGEEVFATGKIDKKEAFDVGLDYAGEPIGGMLGPNLWPDLPDFKAEVSAYYDQIEALARTLFRGFALALGLEESFFDAKLAAPPSQLRLIRYPHDPTAADAQGIGAHTDYECFTILFSTAPGLEVMNDAGEWIDAPPIPGCFVINISDMMETWTNGAFVATSHRVRKVAEERFSFPFFAACDYPTIVEPLPQFVSEVARPATVASSPASTCSPRPPRPSPTSSAASPTAPWFCPPIPSRFRPTARKPAPHRPPRDDPGRARPRPALRRPLAVPEWTLGCFKRRCITYATGVEDTTTEVIWIQSHGLTGDLRIPASRKRPCAASLPDCPRDELIDLAKSEGFAARTLWDGALMSWDAFASFQPYDKWPEPARLERVGPSLIEWAPSGIYVEDWRLQPGSDGLSVGLSLESETGLDGVEYPRAGTLVIAGDHALRIIQRRADLEARPLHQLLAQTADPVSLARDIFDGEVSYARRAGSTFVIENAMNPFDEGATLFEPEAFSSGSGEEYLTETGLSGQNFICRRWRIDTLLADQARPFSTAAQTQALAWFQRERETLLGQNI